MEHSDLPRGCHKLIANFGAPGFHHCAFDVDSRADVDGLHYLLIDRNIRVLDAPAEYPQYAPGYYAVYFEDADGLKFEVVHMPEVPA